MIPLKKFYSIWFLCRYARFGIQHNMLKPDKMMMLFVNDERKKVIQKRINERDINYAETMFNRKENLPCIQKTT